MKKLLLILLLATTANADTIATAENNNGGLLVLTDVQCKEKKTLVAYSTNKNNQTLFGCWFLDDSFVFITWNDGDTRTYPFYIWNMRKKGSSM